MWWTGSDDPRMVSKLHKSIVFLTARFGFSRINLHRFDCTDLCSQSEIGYKLFEDYLKERIQNKNINIWSPMKKKKLSTWKTTEKRVTVRKDQKVVELKEDRSLFARMLIVCQTRPDINLKEAIGKHEFSVVPRSLFAPDRSMLH